MRALTISSASLDSSVVSVDNEFTMSFNKIDIEFQEQIRQMSGIKNEEVDENKNIEQTIALSVNDGKLLQKDRKLEKFEDGQLLVND